MFGTWVRPLELQFMLTMSLLPLGLVILKRVMIGYSCLSWGMRMRHTRHRTGLRPAAPQEAEDISGQSQPPSSGAQMRPRTEIIFRHFYILHLPFVICTFTLKSENDIPVLFAFEPADTICILTKLRLQSQSRLFPAMSRRTFLGGFFLSVELRSSGNDAIRLKLGRKCHQLQQWCHCHKIWWSK